MGHSSIHQIYTLLNPYILSVRSNQLSPVRHVQMKNALTAMPLVEKVEREREKKLFHSKNLRLEVYCRKVCFFCIKKCGLNERGIRLVLNRHVVC